METRIILYWFLILTILYVCSASKDSKPQDKTKVTKDKKQADHKGNKKPADPANTNDDYDTSQGYPILYPETHMMSLKRNITTQPNGSYIDVDDDEQYEANILNRTNTSSDEPGKCGKSVDILFLLDSSESVKYFNWKIIIQFVKDLCNRFQLHSTRVGIIRYASEAEISLPLTEFNDTESRNLAIDNIFYKTGGTRTDIALKKAAEVLHIEEQRSQVLILVTDGPTNRLEINKDHFVEGKDLVVGPADVLKEAGVALFCVGVEPDSETPEEIETMKDEMGVIASEPTKQHLFMSDGYRELERRVELVSSAACVVNGAWSTWSEYSPCSVTCGYGTKVRMRTCTNPSPENNGADCTGPRVEIQECALGLCSFLGSDAQYPTISIKQSQSKEPTKSQPITSKLPEANKTEVMNNNTSSVEKNTTIVPVDKVSNDARNVNSSTKNSSSLLEQNPPSGIPLNVRWFAEDSRTTSTSKENSTSDKPHIVGCYEGLEEVKLNDSQYNASSVYSHDTDDEYVKREYAAPNARLNNEINGGGWCAEHRYAANGDKNQYLQFDLGKQMAIDAVATQGSHLLENWVKSYNLRYSDDGISWEYYAKNPLVGNRDRSAVQRTMLSPPVTARYVQLNPIEWNEQNGGPEKHDICMRAALYKCRDGIQAHVKRGVIHAKFGIGNVRNDMLRGVVLREKETPLWLHYPGQKTELTLLSYDRKKRQAGFIRKHHKGHKRIFHRLRKMAKNIMKKMRKRLQAF